MYKKAFSLIELLISLIIISLIAAAFVPVATKKLKYQNAALSTGTINCKKFGDNCLICDKTNCTFCSTQLNNVEGKYVEPSNGCEYKDCPKNCIECDDKKCKKCKTEYQLSPDEKSCVEKWIYPNAQNCALIDAIYIPASYNGAGGKDLCVTKYNMGDNGLDSLGAKNVNVGQNCSGACCWKGLTTRACKQLKGSYDPCNRTVCTYSAALNLCENYAYENGMAIANEWKLPSKANLEGWKANFNKISNDLQLCDYVNGYGTSYCEPANTCLGASSACDSYRVWSNKKYSMGTLHQGTLFVQTYDEKAAFSTRCVTERFIKK